MDAVNALTAAAATHTTASSAVITTSAAVQAASSVQHSVVASPSVAAPPLPNGAVGAAPTGNLASVPAPLVTVRLPASARLGPLEFISQTLNNCGPASVAEVLHYWGINRTQGAVQAVLRADGNPRGMEPFGVPSYIRSLGMAVVMGVEGTDTVVKALVAKGFPVIVNQWVSLNDHAGHFRPIEAYDDGRGGFVASDPYLGPNHFISYAEFDQIWRTNRGRFMVIHPPSRQAQVQAILKSAGWDQTIAYQTDLTQQQQHHWPAGVNPPAKFAEFGRSFGALNQAFDQIQLGQFAAARAALAQAKANNANPVLVNWITALLPA